MSEILKICKEAKQKYLYEKLKDDIINDITYAFEILYKNNQAEVNILSNKKIKDDKIKVEININKLFKKNVGIQ